MSNHRARAALNATLAVHQEDNDNDNNEDAVTSLLIDLEHYCREHHINIKICEWHANHHAQEQRKSRPTLHIKAA